MEIKKTEDEMHIIYLGRKAFLAEQYIKSAEIKKDIIKNAVAELDRYFEENKGHLEYIDHIADPCTPRRRLSDAIYFLNKIKEEVKE